MQILEGKYAGWLVAIAAGLLGVLMPYQLSDVSHEATLVGTQWFIEKVIPLVQSYSHLGPLSLYIAAWWRELAGSGSMSTLLDAAIASAIAGLYWYIATRHQLSKKLSNGIVLIGLSAAVGAGALAPGPSPLKLGLVLAFACLASFGAWQRSAPSYWFFGSTERNWRLLLASGVCFSLLFFIELFYALPLALFGLISLRRYSKKLIDFVKLSGFFVVPFVLHSWVWISYFDSRNLVPTWVATSVLHLRLLTGEDIGRFGIAAFVPIVVIFCFALYWARSDSFHKSRFMWLVAVSVVTMGIFVPKVILHLAPLLVVAMVGWADKKTVKKIGASTVSLGGVAAISLAVLLLAANLRVIRLEAGRADLARSYLEQRLVDTSAVFYYGKAAGFYDEAITPSTSFVTSAVFSYDTSELGLVDRLRGENEASSPLFVIIPTSESLRPAYIPRIDEYIEKHYEKTADIDGYSVYRRL